MGLLLKSDTRTQEVSNMNTKRLKHNDIKPHRDSLQTKQGSICPLCRGKIPDNDAVLDHCHTTGRVRAVLHNDCNMLLGKVENFVKGRGKRIRDEGNRFSNFCANVYTYTTTNYNLNPLHPKHLTPKDKKIRMYKRRYKAAKKQETKDKYRKLIQETLDD